MPFNPVFAKFAVVDKQKPIARQIPLKLGVKAEAPPVEEVKLEKPAVSLLLTIIGLFIVSSFFQTLAWYYNIDGRLAFWTGFILSMGFVVMEYLCMIPANQMGYKFFSLIQLGIIVEFINWFVFILYVKYVRHEEITSRSWIGLGIMAIAIVVIYS